MLRVTLIFALALTCAGCGGTETAASQSGPPRVLDVPQGTYRGLQVGDTAREARGRFGRTKCANRVSPLGTSYHDIGGPYTSDYRSRANETRDTTTCTLRYRHLALMIHSVDGAFLIVTDDPAAETDRGVGVGDSVDDVRARYPRAECNPFEDSGDADSAAGNCSITYGRWRGEAFPPVVLSFGLDPDGHVVRSIYLNTTTPGAIARARRR